MAVSVVRPANTYGPWDDFWSPAAMVVPQLIRQAVEDSVLQMKGDGSAVRDFIHARDVARGMLFTAKQSIDQPMNLGSGTGVSLRELVDVIADTVIPRPRVEWGTEPPPGDKVRVLDTSRAYKLLGFEPEIFLEEGIQETVQWFVENGEKYRNSRYTVS